MISTAFTVRTLSDLLVTYWIKTDRHIRLRYMVLQSIDTFMINKNVFGDKVQRPRV